MACVRAGDDVLAIAQCSNYLHVDSAMRRGLSQVRIQQPRKQQLSPINRAEKLIDQAGKNPLINYLTKQLQPYCIQPAFKKLVHIIDFIKSFIRVEH
jgi:hypothetical protein